MATVIIIMAALLVAYAVYSTVQKARGKSKSSCCGTPEVKNPLQIADRDESHYPYKYAVSVDGMMCSNCAAHVQEAFNRMGGTWATVHLGKAKAEILSKTEMSESDFSKALDGTNYTVTQFEQIK